MTNCYYCSVTPDEAWVYAEHALAVPHPAPVTPVHMVVAPRRHVVAFYDLDVQEQRAVWNLVSEIRAKIAAALTVEGFDVGFEDGIPANQNHALVHVAPRMPGRTRAWLPGVEWVNADSL